MKSERRTGEKSAEWEWKSKELGGGWGLAFGLSSPAGKRNTREGREGKEGGQGYEREGKGGDSIRKNNKKGNVMICFDKRCKKL